MSKYNFEENNKEFDKTICLTDLNKKIQSEEANEDNDDFYNDKNDKQVEDDVEKKKKINANPNVILTIVIASILFVAIIFVSAFAVKNIFSDNKKGDSSTIENAEDIFSENGEEETYVIKAFKNNIVYLMNMENGKIYSAETDSDTVITGVSGGKINYSELSEGDIVCVVKNEKTGTASQIKWAEEAWKKEEKGDVRVDIGSSSVVCGEDMFKYNENTLFIYKGEEIKPEDISHADIVNITGIKNNIVSIVVEKRHGYVYFKNIEKVNNIKASVDFGEEVDVSSGTLIIPEGKHTIKVVGTNIDDYVIEVTVNDTQSAEIDLSSANEKTSKLTLDVKPSGTFKISIDGKSYPDGTKKFNLSEGKYIIEISRQGFYNYKEEITINEEEKLVEVDFEKLKIPEETKEEEKFGNLTVYSEPGWAEVYIDGEYKGVAPVMQKLSYGEHTIRILLDGYEEKEEVVNIDSAEKVYKGIFE